MMISALKLEDVQYISALAEIRARDNRAMQAYLGYGEYVISSTLASVSEAGAFDCPEHFALRDYIDEIGEAGRRELAALVLLARGERTTFQTAMAQARAMADADRKRFIIPKPLHLYLPVALDRLGLTSR
jgi:hypothetical protein